MPGRVFTLATLFYALLAGAGAQWPRCAAPLERRGWRAKRSRAGVVAAAGVAAPRRRRRRRRRPPRPSGRAPAGARPRSGCPGRSGPAHRRRLRPRLAVLLDRRLLQDPGRQQHLRHARGRRPARRHGRLPRQGERREAPLLRDPHRRAAPAAAETAAGARRRSARAAGPGRGRRQADRGPRRHAPTRRPTSRSTRSARARRRCTAATDAHEEASRARGDPARRAVLRDA